MNQQLVFIYNAKSGFMHGIADLMRKKANPSTYPCKLCQITYSGATMNKLWKQYVASLPIPSVFMHRNEFEAAHPSVHIKYPAVLLKTDKSFRTVLSAEDFSRLNDLADLINTLNERLPRGQSK